MSNFLCEKCGKNIIDTPDGYITECEHYPIKKPKEYYQCPEYIKVVCCPVCNGRGFLPCGFYSQSDTPTSSGTAPENCRSCHGKGYINI